MAGKEIAVKKYVVRLDAVERDRLNELIRKGKRSAPAAEEAAHPLCPSGGPSCSMLAVGDHYLPSEADSTRLRGWHPASSDAAPFRAHCGAPRGRLTSGQVRERRRPFSGPSPNAPLFLQTTLGPNWVHAPLSFAGRLPLTGVRP